AAALVVAARNAAAPRLARLHAVWALGELGEAEPALFAELCSLCADADAEVRAQAARTLGRAAHAPAEQREPLGRALSGLLADDSPRVRSLAAISLGKLRYQPALGGLLAMARADAARDATLRHAATMGLAGSQSPQELLAAGAGASDAERLALVVALGRQNSPLVARFLQDASPRVELEAARVIWDAPIPEAYPDLAAVLPRTPSDNEPLLRRALAAASALGGSERAGEVVACGLRRDLPGPMRDHVWALVRQWSLPSPRDPVHGQWRPAAARPPEEVVAALHAAFAEVLSAAEASPVGVVVAAELGIAEAHAPLIARIADERVSPRLRARALVALAGADEAIVRQAASHGLASTSPEVRSAARRLLVERQPEQAVVALREAAESGATSERQAAIDMLAKVPLPAARAAIDGWLRRVEEGSCPPELQLEVLEAAGNSSDSEVVRRQEAYRERLAANGPAAVYAGSLVGGDAERGRALFHENAALSCRRCHSIEPGTVLVGPSLADAGKRLSRQQLLESIVSPNATIAEGFQTTGLLLDSGQMVAGVIRREDQREAVLVDAEGREHTVEVASIEERSRGLSAMPEDLVKLMSPRELRDLVEYLSTLRQASVGGSSEH
ncbi:MAG: hypothetical protein DCC67_07055, partial [Planctomycetota bacterium]